MHHDLVFENTHFIISSIVFIIMFGLFLFRTGKWRIIIKLLKRRMFVVNMLFISAYCFYIFNMADKKDKQYENLLDATKKAILALIIAFFAHLDTMVSTFWFVWMVGFYMSGFL